MGMATQTQFGHQLKEARRSSPITVKEAASEVDVAEATIYRWEAGTGSVPPADKLADLAYVYATPEQPAEKLFLRFMTALRGELPLTEKALLAGAFGSLAA